MCQSLGRGGRALHAGDHPHGAEDAFHTGTDVVTLLGCLTCCFETAGSLLSLHGCTQERDDVGQPHAQRQVAACATHQGLSPLACFVSINTKGFHAALELARSDLPECRVVRFDLAGNRDV